jgi:hypothetical protein
VSGARDRPPPALVESPADSATATVPSSDSAPAPPTLPPGREARRSPGTTPRPGPAAQAATEPARPRRESAAAAAPSGAPDTAAARRREARRAAAFTAPATPAGPPAVGAEAGRLFVNASPWGQLYVDGQLLGNTPKANLSLSPGSHAVRVVREGYEPFERTVQILSGQSVRLTDIVLVERRP